MTLDFNHVYILAWYDWNGRGYLTTWDGDLPYVTAVITGVTGLTMPFWDAPVPPSAELHAIPEGRDADEYAREIGGYRVLAWYIADGSIERKPLSRASTS